MGIFRDLQTWMHRLCQDAEVNKFGIHAIRHLTASVLIENDAALIDIQTILRHKSISTTEKYLHRQIYEKHIKCI